MTVLSVRDFDAATARRLAAEGVPARIGSRAWPHVASQVSPRPDWCWMD